MNEDFIKLAQTIIKERGKDILFNKNLTKALFMDYSRGEYKNEINFLIKTIELGFSNKIKEADNLNSMKLILSKQLIEDHFINEKMASGIVSLVIMLIRDENYFGEIFKKEEIKPVIKEEQKITREVQLKKNKLLEEDIVKRSTEIWICGRCNTKNDFDYDYCKKCGKEFNPPIVNSNNRSITKLRPGLWESKK